MRSPDDLIRIRVTSYALIDLDKERIESDPVWTEVSRRFDCSDPEQQKQALFQYVGLYISRELLFDSNFMPATNGPAGMFITDMEVIEGQ